jgi:hypothetical protein
MIDTRYVYRPVHALHIRPLSSFFLPYIFISIYRQGHYSPDELAEAQTHLRAQAEAEPQFMYHFRTLAEARAQADTQAMDEDSDTDDELDQPRQRPHKLTPAQLHLLAEITAEEDQLKLDLDKKTKTAIRKFNYVSFSCAVYSPAWDPTDTTLQLHGAVTLVRIA